MLGGRYTLRAQVDPHAPSAPLDVVAGERDIELRLCPGASISGRVVDPEGGPPPYDIQIAASAGDSLQFELTTANTSGTGAFVFAGLEAASYDVVASSTGGRFGVARAVRIGEGQAKHDVEVRLSPGGRVRIRSSLSKGWLVVWSDDVRLQRLDPNPDGPIDCVVPPGRVRVEAVRSIERDGGWFGEVIARQSIDVAPGETKELTVEPPK